MIEQLERECYFAELTSQLQKDEKDLAARSGHTLASARRVLGAMRERGSTELELEEWAELCPPEVKAAAAASVGGGSSGGGGAASDGDGAAEDDGGGAAGGAGQDGGGGGGGAAAMTADARREHRERERERERVLQNTRYTGAARLFGRRRAASDASAALEMDLLEGGEGPRGINLKADECVGLA